MSTKRLWNKTYVEVPLQPHVRKQLQTPLLSLFDAVVQAEQKKTFMEMKHMFYITKIQVKYFPKEPFKSFLQKLKIPYNFLEGKKTAQHFGMELPKRGKCVSSSRR